MSCVGSWKCDLASSDHDRRVRTCRCEERHLTRLRYALPASSELIYLRDYSQTLYTRATRAELGEDFSLAFKLYVRSAEEFLHLSRTASDASVRGRWKAEAAKALGRAEKIKARKEVAPVVSDPFSERACIC